MSCELAVQVPSDKIPYQVTTIKIGKWLRINNVDPDYDRAVDQATSFLISVMKPGEGYSYHTKPVSTLEYVCTSSTR